MRKFSKQTSDEEEAASLLKQSLTPKEAQQVWGKHQTHLNHNPLEKEEHEALSKKDKGLSAALWLMRKVCKNMFTPEKKSTLLSP